MAFQILQTKLYIPPPRSDAVPRPRLIGRLEDGLRRGARLSLVSAPAGFGKSCLLSQWIFQHSRQGSAASTSEAGSAAPDRFAFAWLSLEKSDNEPVRFWGSLAAALESAAPGAGMSMGQTARVIPMPGPDAPEEVFEEWLNAVLVPFLNEISERPGRLALVLDDYHVIENPALQAGIGFLLKHLPPNLHLVIATRADPPLPLHRLRARGQLTELRAADLRFSLDETGLFLRDRLGLPASDADLRTLAERTEGWAAGLQMAGLALLAQSGGETGSPGTGLADQVAAFSGGHQYVIDYLAEEVLDRLPAETQDFLLTTSILERFTAELCDELRKDEGDSMEDEGKQAVSGSLSHHPSSFLLDSLARANLFLIPLDGTRTWFRYHHLFADLLRARLCQSAPERTPELHRRAAAWLDAQGLDDEAFGHAVAGEDFARAGRIVKRSWQRLGHAGMADVALEWLRRLPREVVLSDSEYSSATAWMLHVLGRQLEMEPHMADAAEIIERDIAAGRLEPGSYAYRESVGQLAALRGILAARQGDFRSAETYARQVLDVVPPEYALIQGIGRNMLAGVLRARGSLRAAEREFELAVRQLRGGRNFIAEAIAIYYWSRTLISLGRLAEAEGAAQDGMEAAQASGMGRSPAFGMLEIALAETRREQDRLEEAEALVESGLRRGAPGGVMEIVRQGGALRVRLLQDRGDLLGAQAALRQTRAALNRMKVIPVALAEIDALDAWLQLRQGQRPAALAWAARLGERPIGAPRMDLEISVLARVWIADGRPQEALAVLDGWLPVLETGERWGDLAQARLLRALANWSADWPAAQADLTRALTLGCSIGLRRTFLDEGPDGTRILEEWRSQALRDGPLSPELGAALTELLGEPVSGPAHPEQGAADQPDRQANQELVEPLSERELEILRLMAAGASNRQIGERLFLALGTVKTHVHNISGKLGAQNRVEAIAIAREKGVLG